MPSETQADFSGGINTRVAPHKIAPNQVAEIKNADLSFGDVRGEYGLSDGGQVGFFYEAASAWISGEGLSGDTQIETFPSDSSSFWAGSGNDTVVTANRNFFTGSPNAKIKDNETLKLGQFTVTGNIFKGSSKVTLSGSSTSSQLRVGNSITNTTFFPAGTKVQRVLSDENAVLLSQVATKNSLTAITFTVDVILTFYETIYGIHSANNFVEYNDDLYASRSDFTITAETTAGSKTVTTGGDTYKLQIGDEFFDNSKINAGSSIISTNPTTGTIVLDEPAKSTTPSAESFTIRPIISKFLDGNFESSYRVGVNAPTPIITFSPPSPSEHGDRANSHSAAWFSSTDPIPFQYGLSAYDETGVESNISQTTEASIGGINAGSFTSTANNDPMILDFANIDAYSTNYTSQGRHALYRVGGTSAFFKRLDNLFFDTDLQVTTSLTGSTLTVALTGAKNDFQYKVRWNSFEETYSFSGTNPTFTYPNTGKSKSGETDYRNPSTQALDFDLVGQTSTAANHKVDIFIYMKIPGENVEREYVVRCLTHNGANVTNADTVDYIDFQKADSIVDIQPLEEEAKPEAGLKGLTESSNLFFAYRNNRLHVSDYGNPNSWPASGFVDFDQNITGLATLGTELIVFTEYGMYRIFGSDPSLLKKIKIPTTEGVVNGTEKTITPINGGIIFPSHNGICIYNGRGVNLITKNILDSFSVPDSKPSANVGGYFDNVYYLVGKSGDGFKLDLKGAPVLTKTSINAETLFFRGSDNTLYSDQGIIGKPTYTTGVSLDRSVFTLKTRKFDAGDINSEKIYYSVKVTGENFKGDIALFVDEVQTDIFSITTAVADLDRTFYLSSPRQGNGAQIRVVNGEGILHRLTINFDMGATLTSSLFQSVDIKYTGTPTVKVNLDGATKLSQTTLAQPTSVIGEATLYFDPLSTGLIPHLIEINNEASGRVLSYQYSASPI